MTDFKKTSCKLCLKTLLDNSFGVIDAVIRDILDFLLLKLKCDGNSGEVVCKTCRIKLSAASEFKSLCLYTNNIIIPYMDCEKMLQLDLGEVYVKENGNVHLMSISYNPKICRLCMQLIKGEVRCIGEEELEAIHKFAPEMNISIIKDPVICKTCLDSLNTHNNFVKDCSGVEQTVGDIFKSSATEKQTDTSLSGLFIKTENLDKECVTTDVEMAIKNETVNIKSENEDDCSDTLPYLNNETLTDSDLKDTEEKNCKNGSVNKRDIRRMYKCDVCDYETMNKAWIKRHYVKHKAAWEVPIFKCSDCDYVTKYKSDLTRHQKKHKSTSEAEMYKCDHCDYTTKYKYYLEHHSLRHKDSSQVRIYKCNACHYESRFKKNLARHQVLHKDPSEVPIYKCKDCDYETKHRNGIQQHLLKHKDPSQVQRYKCDDCGYETIHKATFADHLLGHKDPSEVQMFKCDVCKFQSRHKRSLQNHLLTHKRPSEVQMYKCDACDFKTKYKGSLKSHELKHKKKLLQFK